MIMGQGANEKGASRYHIIKEVEASLRRLNTDYIDVYFIHNYDQTTPMEETLSALDNLISTGKTRYIGCSNFTSWQVMKALATSERHGLSKYVVYQGYYSLIGRDYEWDLMPLAEDQKIGLMAWSPLGWGRLTGKIRRGEPLPQGRIGSGGAQGGPEVSDEFLFRVLDVLEAIATELNKTVAQVAINWLLQRPTVSNVVIGARDENQLRENLGATGWSLTTDQIRRLDEVSAQKPMYPHWVGGR